LPPSDDSTTAFNLVRLRRALREGRVAEVLPELVKTLS